MTSGPASMDPEQIDHDRLLPAALAALPCAIAIVGKSDFRILAANPVWADMAVRFGAGAPGSLCSGLFPGCASLLSACLRSGRAVRHRDVPATVPAHAVATWWNVEIAPHPDAPSLLPGLLIVTAREATDDVLVRRDAEDSQRVLSSTDARYMLAQEATGIGTWEWDLARDVQAWSPAQFRLFGMDPVRDVPPSFDDLMAQVHPDDREWVRAALKHGASVASGTHQLEFRLHPSGGGETWVLYQSRAVSFDASGRPTRVIGISQDVTERRREQEALAEDEARLRLAFSATRMFAWDLDVRTGRVCWTNGLEEALKMAPGSFGGDLEAFRALVHPDDLDMVNEAVARALRGDTAEYHATFRMCRADGSFRWTDTRGVVTRDPQGAPLRLFGVDHDITEQRDIETTLRESEARLRLAMKVAGLGAWEADLQTGRNLRDGTLSALLGEPPEQVLVPPGGLFDRVTDNDRARVRAIYDAALSSGTPFEAEFRVLRRDGEERLFSSQGVMATPHRMIGVIRDVTGDRRLQALLRESATRLRGLYDNMFQFVGMLSPDGTILSANRAALEFVGMSLDDVIGTKIWDSPWFAANATTRDQVRRAVDHARTGKFVRYQVELQGAARTASVDFCLRPVRDDAGAVILLVPEAHDITEFKNAEADLTRRESESRAILHAMPQHAFTARADGTNDYKSRGWFDYTGLTLQETQGLAWTNALHPDDREASIANWQNAVATGRPYESLARLRRADGTYRWFLARAVQVQADEPTMPPRWVGGTTDVTALVEARDRNAFQLEEAQRDLAVLRQSIVDAARELEAEIRRRAEIQSLLVQSQKLEAMGQLTSSVAHDFNNMLAAIIGSYSLIRRRTNAEKVLGIVTRGEQAASRAVKLIQQLLAFARHDAITAETLDVSVVLNDMADLIRHAIGPHLVCAIDVPPMVWPVVADPNQLGIAILNLAVNARDAMPQGGEVTISARNIQPDTEGEGGTVAISVRDAGHGMSAATLARAREAFFTTKPAGRGTGLGLSMVQDFARKSGGWLTIDSAPDEGTVVEIMLPRAAMIASSPERIAALREISAPSYALHGHANILLVEDDEQVRPLTADYLRDLGYEVTEAATAEAAMILLHLMPSLDLLMTDVALPGQDGIGLAKHLRQDRAALPVVFITGTAHHPALGAELVVCKPYADHVLAKAILTALGRKIMLDPTRAEPLLSRLTDPGLRALLLDWHSVKADGAGYPHPTSLDPARYGLAPNAFTAVIEAAEAPLFHYVQVGSALVHELARRGTELVSAEAAGDEVVGTLDGVYRRCVKTAAPVFQAARYDFGDGSPYSYQRLILPASMDGLAITHLIGIVLFGTGDSDKAGDPDRAGGSDKD